MPNSFFIFIDIETPKIKRNVFRRISSMKNLYILGIYMKLDSFYSVCFVSMSYIYFLSTPLIKQRSRKVSLARIDRKRHNDRPLGLGMLLNQLAHAGDVRAA